MDVITSDRHLYRRSQELQAFLTASETIVSSLMELATGLTLREYTTKLTKQVVRSALFGAPIDPTLWGEIANPYVRNLKDTRAFFDILGSGILQRNLAGPVTDEIEDKAVSLIDERIDLISITIGTSSKSGSESFIASLLDRDVPDRLIERSLPQVLGLNPRWARSLSTQHQVLEERKDLKRAQKDQLFGSYATKARKSRFDTIARTETHRMSNAIHDAMMGDEERMWATSLDERVCSTCKPLDGRRREPGEPFTYIDDEPIYHPPVHVNCRCMVIPSAWLDNKISIMERLTA